MALPGTPGQRISDLCNGNRIRQKELAEKAGVSASRLGRIVSGETKAAGSGSERAAKRPATGAVDAQILNRLLGTQEFPQADRFATDLFSGHSRKGRYGTKPAY